MLDDMETGPSFRKRRVILRANGKRHQVSVTNSDSDLEGSVSKVSLNKAIDSKDVVTATGMVVSRSVEEMDDTSSLVVRDTVTKINVSDAQQITVAPYKHEGLSDTEPQPIVRQLTDKVHPVEIPPPHSAFETSPTNLDQRTWPQFSLPKKLPPLGSHTTASTPGFGYEPLRSINSPLSNLGDQSLLMSPDFNASGPLQPLLTASARKGGRTASADTDWSFDGKSQLESLFPDKLISIYVATWNMHNEKELPESLDDLLLPQTSYTMPELYVIGTQETSSNKKEWEILIQQTIGPTHILLQSASLGSLHLVLFIRRDLLWYCSGVKSANYATRPLSQFKTKGAVGLIFNLFGTSFLFITSHLSAHQQRVEDRNSDFKRISSYFALPDTPAKNKAEVMEYDYVFWFGDLNYRVEMSRDECNELLTRSNILELLLNDQLTREILEGNTFYHFSEQPITFNPSYKFDLDSDVYDTSQKRRTPSWTDRILFQSRDSRNASVTGHGYHCCENIRISDHRPVYAYFKASLQPCNEVDGIHDMVTTFNADIYNKANRRRKVTAEQSLELRKTRTSSTQTPSSSTSSTGHREVSSAYCILL